MKTPFRLIRFLALAGGTICFNACITTTTRVTAPDGTITETTVTEPVPGLVETGAHVAHKIIVEK